MEEKGNDKPKLLKAIELILADPIEIKKETECRLDGYRKKWNGKKIDDEIADMVAKKIISNYSYLTAFIGGATAVTSIVPGLGTVLAVSGGATADAALSMKYQIEMTMAIAVVYGHDISIEEEKRVCMVVAGLGTINQASKEGTKAVSSKAFVKMTQQYLKGATLQTVKEIFKKVGVTFTRKAVEKSIPFGVGVVIGATANKGLTYYVGKRAMSFYKVTD